MSYPFRGYLHLQSYTVRLDHLQEQPRSEVIKILQVRKLLLHPASPYSKVKKIWFLCLLFWFLSFASSIRKENKILTWKYTRFCILCKLVGLFQIFSLAFFYFWVLVYIYHCKQNMKYSLWSSSRTEWNNDLKIFPLKSRFSSGLNSPRSLYSFHSLAKALLHWERNSRINLLVSHKEKSLASQEKKSIAYQKEKTIIKTRFLPFSEIRKCSFICMDTAPIHSLKQSVSPKISSKTRNHSDSLQFDSRIWMSSTEPFSIIWRGKMRE